MKFKFLHNTTKFCLSNINPTSLQVMEKRAVSGPLQLHPDLFNLPSDICIFFLLLGPAFFRVMIISRHRQAHYFTRFFFRSDFLVVAINPLNSLSGGKLLDVWSFFKRSMMTACSATFFW